MVVIETRCDLGNNSLPRKTLQATVEIDLEIRNRNGAYGWQMS